MPKWLPFCKPPPKIVFATLDDLHEVEQRLTKAILEVASGDKDKLNAIISELHYSASNLRIAINNNQNQRKDRKL